MIVIGLPQCSTCKAIEKQLKSKGIAYTYRNITTEIPTVEELKTWFALSGESSFKKIVNTSGQKYRELNVKDQLAQADTLEAQLAILAQDGMLIKRPILLTGDCVYWGKAVETYVSQLD
ncbi:MAG: Spx/MgsR family RNA polymerase-binding regulatory protein [Aerococcaceae bacterium]|nr:Spx/MgsR family RNA polymerase-binding regulatory protein [Aerococcaceae bacterium]